MPEINFQTIKSTIDGVNASTGKQTEVAFNNNFANVKNFLTQLFSIAAVTIISDEMTSIKVDTTTTPYTLYYTIDDVTNNPTWIPLINVGFSEITGSPTDNIALNAALSSKGSASDVSTLKIQMQAAQGNISTLQTTVGTHTTEIGANTLAINGLRTDVANRVRTPSGDTLYLRYVQATNAIQYSTDGTNYTDILSSGISFSGITGNASDNASLVSYVGTEITNALNSIATFYVSLATFNGHATNYSNPHNVTKAQLGLGNVDNTSDMDKPISTAVQNALNQIAGNTPPVYDMTPADYRSSGALSQNEIYFTSNSFAQQNNS